MVTVSSAGGSSRAVFTGTARQRVAVRATNTSILAGKVRLEDSSGTALRSSGLNAGGAWLDMVTLPADDTYSIVVDASGTHTGSTTLWLYDEPADPTAALAPGTPSTLTTTTPGQNASFTFNGTAGWNLSLKLSASTPIVNLLVKNPDGTTLMPAVGVVGGKWVEPLDLPQTGTYTIKVDPQSFAKGSQTVTAWTFHGDQTATAPADGSTHTFHLATPGQNGSLYVSAASGDRLSFTFTGVSGSPSKMWIKNPDGTVLVPTDTLLGSGAMVEPVVVGQAGEYHAFLNPATDTTGSVTVRAYTVPPDMVDDVAADGSSNPVSFTIPGQNAKLRFSGTAGQSVSVRLTSSVADTDYQLLKPNGNVLASGTVDTSGDFLDPITLPVDGTYKLVLDPQSYFVGTMTATIYDVPNDASVAGAVNTTTSAVHIGTPGQNGEGTFAGTAGQRVSVTASGVTISSSTVYLRRPDGSTLGNPISVGTSGGFLSPLTLPSNGTYSVEVDPDGAATGDVSLHLDVVPGDATFPIAPDGVPVTALNSEAGQNMQVTFSGTAGTKVSLVLSNVTLGPSGANVRITSPDGSTLISTFFVDTSGGYVDTFTLPSNGTYTIRVDPQGTAVGSADLTLYTVPANATGTVTPNGPTAAIATTVPGQSAKLTFTGGAGWTLVLTMESTTCCATRVSITAPNGTTKLAPTSFPSTGGQISVPLSIGGTYTVTIDPQGSAIGTHRITLTH